MGAGHGLRELRGELGDGRVGTDLHEDRTGHREAAERARQAEEAGDDALVDAAGQQRDPDQTPDGDQADEQRAGHGEHLEPAGHGHRGDRPEAGEQASEQQREPDQSGHVLPRISAFASDDTRVRGRAEGARIAAAIPWGGILFGARGPE